MEEFPITDIADRQTSEVEIEYSDDTYHSVLNLGKSLKNDESVRLKPYSTNIKNNVGSQISRQYMNCKVSLRISSLYQSKIPGCATKRLNHSKLEA